LGSLIALTLPFAVAFYLGGMALTIAWVSFELPVGPGASVYYEQTNLLPPPLP
jgi:aminobenzoyl-glutamate transport protein